MNEKYKRCIQAQWLTRGKMEIIASLYGVHDRNYSTLSIIFLKMKDLIFLELNSRPFIV